METKKKRLEIESTPASRVVARVCRYLTIDRLAKVWKSVLIWSAVLGLIGGVVWVVSNIDTFEGGRVKGASIVAKHKHIRSLDYEGLTKTILAGKLNSIDYQSSARTLLNEEKLHDALVEANNALECLRAAGIAFSELVNKYGHTLTIVEEREMEDELADSKESVLKVKQEITDAIWNDENKAKRLAAQREEQER